jgi:hypothetical protein
MTDDQTTNLNGVHLKSPQLPLPFERELGRRQLFGKMSNVLIGPQVFHFVLQLLHAVVVGSGRMAAPVLLDRRRGVSRLRAFRYLIQVSWNEEESN